MKVQGFDEWLAAFTRDNGKPTAKMAAYLAQAYEAGAIVGGRDVLVAVKPALVMILEVAELGVKAYETTRTITASLSDVCGIDLGSLRSKTTN